MKFCQETLFEADRALFMNSKKGRVLPGKSCTKPHFVAFEMADKAKPSRSLLLMALCCINFLHENQITIQ